MLGLFLSSFVFCMYGCTVYMPDHPVRRMAEGKAGKEEPGSNAAWQHEAAPVRGNER